MQFAKVAHATDFLYCYSIIESNRRSDYAPESQQSTGTKSRPVIHPAIVGSSMHAELNTFFPFDPYKLPKSSTYIQDVYREWASVAIDDDDEDDDSEEEEDAEEEEGHNSRRSMHDQSRSKREETLGRKRAEKDVYRKGMERKKQKAEGTQWSR